MEESRGRDVRKAGEGGQRERARQEEVRKWREDEEEDNDTEEEVDGASSSLSVAREWQLQEAGESTCSVPTCSPTGSGSVTDGFPEDRPFRRHKVEKTDTLASVAVKYNVAVADIKRANCLDSDTTMYGRGTLLVPTKPMPLNAELAAWVSLTEAQMNSKGIAHRPVRYLRPGVIGALTELRGYYSTGPSLSPSPLYSDGEDEDQGDAEESLIDFEALRQGLPGRRARSPREVELMTRNGSQGASSSYIEERLRRRKGPGEDDDGCMSVEPTGRIAGNPGCINDSTAPLPQSSKQKHLFESSLEGRRARSGNSMGGLQDINFQEWKRRGQQWRDQVLNRLKRAASQPALLQTAASLVSRASGPSFGGPDLGNRMSQPGSVVQPGSAGASSSGTLAGIGLRPSKESSKAD